MSGWDRLADVPADQLVSALAKGSAEMELGAFTMRLKTRCSDVVSYLKDVYRDAHFRLELGDVPDVSIDVRPPNNWRRFIRPQVIPDPGFIVPAVPLPKRLAPLSLEMGLNLSVALKCCRFVSFHAAVVGNENGAMLISAQSGGGKSTLAAALMNEGYRLFSDEFGLLGLSGDTLNAYPRPVSLKDASISIITELTGHDWISETYKGTPKGDIAYRRVRPLEMEKAHIPASGRLILFPVFNKGMPASARALSPSETMMKLIPSSTNYHLLGEHAFLALTNLVNEAKAYEIHYGSTEDSLMMVKDLAAGAGL
jgi:HprK-related kinase A